MAWWKTHSHSFMPGPFVPLDETVFTIFNFTITCQKGQMYSQEAICACGMREQRIIIDYAGQLSTP